MANWAELNHDLLVELADKIRLYNDYLAFRGVCASWRIAASMENYRIRSSNIPWLMLPPKKFSNRRCFFNVSNGMVHHSEFREANPSKCFSSNGWLIMIAKDWGMSLYHPFSLHRIKLPHLKTFKDWRGLSTAKMYVVFVYKCVLSCSPLLTSDCVVAAIHGSLRKLAHCRLGDQVWTTIDTWCGHFFDVIYYNSQIYAVNCNGQVFTCDIRGGNPTLAEEVAKLPGVVNKCYEKFYLVESVGALLVVARLGAQSHKTYGFRVFKLKMSDYKWTEIKNLGNKALFLGENSSVSVKADSSGFHPKPNHIYFTDDCKEAYWCERKGGGKDMGIYNMNDASIEARFEGEITHFEDELLSHINPPMWVEPST